MNNDENDKSLSAGPGQTSGDKTRQNKDENVSSNSKEAGKESPKDVDELVQGKKLEEEERGGDVSDAHEFSE